MKNEVKLSVIVPMYNVKDYVGECLDSLRAQTLRDMEVIMVDDGATDNTAEIASAYAEADPDHFRLVHKKNGGLSDARNYGLQFVRGEYIAFLDSDDFVEPSLYEKLVRLMDEGCDVAVTDIEYWYSDPAKRFVMKGLTDWQADTMQKRAMLSPMFAWNKIYRASWFLEKGLRYPLNTWYEDRPVTTMIFAQAKKIGYRNECLIHYRQREGSIMSSNSSPRVKEIFGIMELVRNNFVQAGLDKTYRDELEYLHVEHLRLYGMFRFIRSPYTKELYEKTSQVMNENYPGWKHNKYISNLNLKNRIFLQCYSPATAWLFNRVIR